MEVAELVDYALPAMNAEKAMKQMHQAMIIRDYDKALEYALLAQVELRLAYTSIQHEKEGQRVIR